MWCRVATDRTGEGPRVEWNVESVAQAPPHVRALVVDLGSLKHASIDVETDDMRNSGLRNLCREHAVAAPDVQDSPRASWNRREEQPMVVDVWRSRAVVAPGLESNCRSVEICRFRRDVAGRPPGSSAG